MCSLRSVVVRKFISQRCFHTTQIRRIDPKTVEEVKIPVPWGHIAGKWWRKNEEQPILALHGLYDNAATFDPLIPFLNENISVLALDIPGFGRTSPTFAGLSPNFLDLIIWLRYLIKDHFKWNKVNFLSHSFGSNLSFTYSGMFPEEVDKFISIECSRLDVASKPKYFLRDFRRAHCRGVIETLGIPYEGGYQLFLDHMYNNRLKTRFKLSKRLCEVLLSRDLEKISDGFYRYPVDRSPYLFHLGRPTITFLDAIAEKIECQMLAIMATGGLFVKDIKELLEKQLSVIAQNSPRLVHHIVEGGHHVHMENPETVASIINNFFESHD